MKHIIIFVCVLFAPIIVSAQEKQIINWSTDLDHILQELPVKHYNLFTKKTENYFQSEIKRIKIRAKNQEDIATVLDIQCLLASMGDAHTMIAYSEWIDKNQLLPLALYWFQGGIFVMHTTKQYADLAGAKILSINNQPINMVIDSLSKMITVDNQSSIKQGIPHLLPSLQILRYFDLIEGDNIVLKYEKEGGQVEEMLLGSSAIDRENIASFKSNFQTDSLALCYRNQKQLFSEDYLAQDKIYYLQYNQCTSKEIATKQENIDLANQLPSFVAFEEKVFETLKSNPIAKIVFDLRFNSGGDSSQGTRSIQHLATFLSDKPNIKVYVVLGRRTFSSAILNALDFKRISNVTFVGEETAGRPNHFGELKMLQLPSSGLRLYYSTKYFKHMDDEANTLHPDVLLESDFSEFSRGIDPVYEWIKKDK